MPFTLRQLLFPGTTRKLPHRRRWLNGLRAVHILSVGLVVGGVFFEIEAARLQLWIAALLLSGAGMLLIDLYASCIILFEIRGISMLVKLLVVACLPVLSPELQFLLLVILVVQSSLISHGTRKFRHRNLLPQYLWERYRPHD